MKNDNNGSDSNLENKSEPLNDFDMAHLVPVSLNKRRVIIVDDDKDILESLGSILTQHPTLNCEPLLFTGGDELMEFLHKKPNLRIDLVLSDVRMENGDGLSLVPRFRRVFPKTPFYLMTGYSDIDEEDAKKLGATGLIKKPFTLSKIINTLLPSYPVKEP